MSAGCLYAIMPRGEGGGHSTAVECFFSMTPAEIRRRQFSVVRVLALNNPPTQDEPLQRAERHRRRLHPRQPLPLGRPGLVVDHLQPVNRDLHSSSFELNLSRS
jgi:hypothetical protein